MTVVVAFYCTDGVVIAADSMITPGIGGINVGHHHGQKISVLSGQQLFAFAGDQGQSDRVKIMADGSHAMIANTGHPIDFPICSNDFDCSAVSGNWHLGDYQYKSDPVLFSSRTVCMLCL